MALPVQEQAKYWGIAAAVIAIVLWFLGDVILPFVLGGAIAYCLDPIADWLERLGLSRALSVAVIAFFALFIFIVLFLLIFPTLTAQATQLASALPDYLTRFRDWLTERFPDQMTEGSVVRDQLSSIAAGLQEQGSKLSSAFICWWTGTEWLPVSTNCCRAIMRR
jgi:predicted PurR-regulated permease PerM